MRIAYIGHSRFPTEKAHGFQIASVCDALASLGHEVTLTVPTIANTITVDPFTYYGLPSSFQVEHLPQFDALHSVFVPEVFSVHLSNASYRRQLRTYFHSHSADVLYLRSSHLLSEVLRTGRPVILELHLLPRFGLGRFINHCRQCALVVCLTSPMRDALIQAGADPRNIIVEGDAVDLRRFSSLPSVSSSKERWNLPTDRPVIGYCGSLVTRDVIEKGVRELIDALALLSKRGTSFQGWIVGGPIEWVERYRRLAEELGLRGQVRFEGAVPTADVSSALHACDVLVYPSPASSLPYFLRDTSPLKIFEYLAAGKPIVAADLPPIRDLLSEEEATFCHPGDPASLADALTHVLTNASEAAAKALRGIALVAKHSWEERMGRILQRLPIVSPR